MLGIFCAHCLHTHLLNAPFLWSMYTSICCSKNVASLFHNISINFKPWKRKEDRRLVFPCFLVFRFDWPSLECPIWWNTKKNFGNSILFTRIFLTYKIYLAWFPRSKTYGYKFNALNNYLVSSSTQATSISTSNSEEFWPQKRPNYGNPI